MLENEYRAWLASQGKEASTQSTSCSMIRRVEAAYGDLVDAFLNDGLETIQSDMVYTKADQRNNEPNPSKLAMDGDLYNGLSSVRTHLGYYRRFLEDQASDRHPSPAVQPPATNDPSADADEPPEAILSLERDLNAALRQSIGQLEDGLEIVDGGKERSVASGRIDILAQDQHGRRLVIELKAVRAPRDAVAQVLAYMGDVQTETGGDVRGMLIAPDFDPKAISAARMVPSLELRRFTFQFRFEAVGHDKDKDQAP